MTPDNASLAEAFLFTEGGSLGLKRLSSLTHLKDRELQEALKPPDRLILGEPLTSSLFE